MDQYQERKRVLKKYLTAKGEEERLAAVAAVLEIEDPNGKLESVKKDIEEKRAQKIEELKRVIEIIEGVPEGFEKQLLTYRYISGMEWENIAVVMNYSWSQMHRIHRKALKKIKV